MSWRGYLIDRLILKQPRLRRWLTRLIYGNREIDIPLLHCPVRVHTIRENGYVRASRLGETSSFYHDEAPVLLALAGLLPWADTFVDCGANVGIYSKLLERFRTLYPQLEFHAFEADPDTARRLAATLAGTGAHVHGVALSDAPGRLRFVRGAVSHVSTRADLASRYQLTETFDVEAQRLDAVGLTGRRLIMKVDVEGQELAVLRGAEQLFAAERVLAVFLDGCGEAPAVAAFLRARGFEFFDARTLRRADDLPYALLGLHQRLFANREGPAPMAPK